MAVTILKGTVISAPALGQLDITENTLKYHNRNIYSKLGVSSRKEMLHIARSLPRD